MMSDVAADPAIADVVTIIADADVSRALLT
jgi:hypothetical protein